MTDFVVHTPATAPDDARKLMEQSLQRFGGVPNLHAVMAESPQLLEAYKLITDLYRACSLSVLERQIILLTINRENGCEYCMAAHSVIAEREKMPPDVLSALRDGRPLPDARLQALSKFTQIMVERRGRLSDADLDEFRAAGYGNRQVLDIVLAVGYKTLSNYTNHVAETPLDAMFESGRWAPAAPPA